jgi:hypothetical protein
LAAFGPPIAISPANQHADDPQVAVDPDGDAVIVWENSSTGLIQARARSAAGTFSAVQTISQGFSNDPQVGMAADGRAIFIWLASEIQVRTRAANGALGAVQTVSNVGQSTLDHRLAVAADGRSVIVWRITNQVQARFRSSLNTLGAVINVSAGGSPVNFPAVAMAGDGDALIAWVRNDGTGDRLQVRSRPGSGAFGPVQNVSFATSQAANPDIAVDADGDGLMVWSNIAQNGDRRIQARANSGGALGPVLNVSHIGSAFRPQADMQGDGDALITWTLSTRIQARHRSLTGVFGGIQNVSNTGSDHSRVAYDENGIAAFIWENGSAANDRVQGRARSAGGVFGAVKNLSFASTDAEDLQLAEGGGRAIAVWVQQDGAGFTRVYASVGP